jgi:hypothetical protein
MIKAGKYSEKEFLAVCKASKIPETSTECAVLRSKFKRVFAGQGTEQEARHVLGLRQHVRKHAALTKKAAP